VRRNLVLRIKNKEFIQVTLPDGSLMDIHFPEDMHNSKFLIKADNRIQIKRLKYELDPEHDDNRGNYTLK
jgi:hypothetical protein